MITSARCKFALASITDHGHGSKEFVFRTQYDKALSEEDRAFSTSTPSGEMKVRINNPAVIEMLVIGQTYYLDLTPTEPQA